MTTGYSGVGNLIKRKMLLLIMAAMVASPVHAQLVQDRPNKDVADEAIAQLRSPYCPGFMLAICTSGQAALLRDSIYDLAAQGMSSDELVEWMLANHGEQWRAEPKMSGLGLMAWVMPPIGFALGLAFLVGWMRKRAREAVPAPASGPSISAAEREQLAKALREWEDSGETEE